MNDLVRKGFTLEPSTFDEAMKIADMVSKSDFVTPTYKHKPANILIAWQMGKELGLNLLQCLQNIAVINGKPSLWGDSMMALVKAHSTCEYVHESFDEDTMTAVCKVKRKGEPEQSRTFSIEDAKAAGLWGKSGPWKSYPKRMLQMRARGFALRDVFADALCGLISAEEAQDYPAEDKRELKYAEVVYRKADQSNKISEDQFAELNSLMCTRDVDIQKFFDYFGASSLSSFPANRFEEAVNMLKKKPEKEEKKSEATKDFFGEDDDIEM